MDTLFKINIVRLILNGDVEEALRKLSLHYNIKSPNLRIGTTKGHRNASAVYRRSNRTIYISNREALSNPVVILHEFYHHLQSEQYGKKGNEKFANKFAKNFFIPTT